MNESKVGKLGASHARCCLVGQLICITTLCHLTHLGHVHPGHWRLHQTGFQACRIQTDSSIHLHLLFNIPRTCGTGFQLRTCSAQAAQLLWNAGSTK